jgi:ribonucleotide reductase alpha subunit
MSELPAQSASLPDGLVEPAFDPNAMRVLKERYFAKRADGTVENPKQFLWRVATAIAEPERPYARKAGRDPEAVASATSQAFYGMMARRDFMPNTPCLVNAGRPLSMLSACFVLPVPDSIEGIFDNLKAMALIQKSGGGTGFAFSELRHQGAEVISTGKDASGPVSFMKVFNAATDSIKQGGVRRGANMGVLKVDHPDIFHFMSCKKELDAENRALWNRMSDTGRYTPEELAHIKQELLQTQINNFNISIGVTDAFMTAVKTDADFDLLDPRTKAVVRTVRAREIWDAIVEGAWQNGEPGVLFLDHPGVNPLPGLGPIQATNPCLTGDTLVAVADGRGHVRIDELAASGKDVSVFCYDDGGRIVVRTMRHPRKTGDKLPVFRVTLDDGSVIRATENHRFRLRDGSYREVRELTAGDSLMILTKFQAPIVDVLHNAKTKSKQNYWWMTLGKGRVRAEHRIIADHFLGEVPRGSVVYHRDRDSENNSPENLEIMTKAARDAHHAASHEAIREGALDLTRALGRRFSATEWSAFAEKRGLPEQFSGWRSENLNGGILGLAKWAAEQVGIGQLANVDPRVVRHFDEALALGYDPVIVGGVLFVTKNCDVCATEFIAPYTYREVSRCSRACNISVLNRDPEINRRRHANREETLQSLREALREKQLDVYTSLRAELGGSVLKRDWALACKERGVSPEISRESSPFRKYAELQDAASTFNHRVVNVEPDALEDVYNGTVDEFHNFFVGGFEGRDRKNRSKYIYLNNANCGEQFLHGFDSCNLGSINVGHFYDAEAKSVDWERLGSTTALAIRFLDNVIDANIYPVDEIRDMVTNNRRVGLGIMGYADLLIQMQIAYGSPEAIAFADKLMEFIQLRAQETSEVLARERGDFPNKHLSIWAGEARPRRNAALLSVAPTGTISMIAGCSFGCEPYFGLAYTKHVMKDSEGRPQHLYYVIPLFEEIAKDEGFFSDELLGKIEENRGSAQGIAAIPARWQAVFTTSADVTVDQHIDMLAAFQKWTDNAVSKTINAPNDDTRENVARAIFRAYDAGCKGFTYYRDGSRTEQVVTFSKDNDLKGGNRDITAPVAGSASPAASPAFAVGTSLGLDIDALLAKANALLEVR